jgi:hypothetical protein
MKKDHHRHTWPILHNNLEPSVLIRALPSRNEMQQMHTFTGLSVFLARITRQLNLHDVEHGNAALFVLQAYETG